MTNTQNILYTQHLSLASFIALCVSENWMQYEIADNNAKYALLEAVEKYDELMNCDFKTFAVSYIKKRLLKMIHKPTRNVYKMWNSAEQSYDRGYSDGMYVLRDEFNKILHDSGFN